MKFTIRFANRLAQAFAGLSLSLLVSFMFTSCEPLGSDSKAKEWTEFLKEKAQAGESAAQYSLGEMYWDGVGVRKDYVEAAKWYRKAAEQGYIEAQRMLGLMYDLDIGVAEDGVEAAKWYRMAAEQGDADAQFNLGRMYYQGDGVPKDDLEAVKWMRAVAEQGYAGARWFIGVMYVNSRDFNDMDPPPPLDASLLLHNIQDIQDALENDMEPAELARQVVEQGNAPAYDDGEGVSKNDMEAYVWVLLAKGQGIEEADKVIELLEKRLTAAQQKEGQTRAAELDRTIPHFPADSKPVEADEDEG